MVILFEGLQKQITLKSEEIKGPNVKAPEVALEGFIRSNNINKKDLFKQTIDKGEFYFFKTKSKKLNTQSLLEGDQQYYKPQRDFSLDSRSLAYAYSIVPLITPT